MADRETFIITGGGLAAAKSAEALRGNGFDGRIVMFTDEVQLPYDRVPLSKDFLAAKTSAIARAYNEGDRRLTLDDLTVHDASWYADHEIELLLGTPVRSIDPAARTVTVADDTVVSYDKLLLATGARARRPALPGVGAAGAHCLRTADDAATLDTALVPGSALAVLGAGWIGLEVAASARSRGVSVSVAGRSRLPLLSALGAELGAIFADLHRGHRVDLRLGAQVSEISTAAGQTTGLTLADGSRLTADTVLVATGTAPRTELAVAAGLAVGDGVLVDASLRSSNPDIYAVGDVAAVEHPLLGTRIRTGHWAEALKQPAVAAAGMLGERAEYTDLPYFFTDQYQLGMEYVGYAPRYRQVVFRGDAAAGEFIAFWLDERHRVLAAMSVNIRDAIGRLKSLVRSHTAVDPARLADPDVPLAELHTG